MEREARALCPECAGKCLTYQKPAGWQSCQTCAGKGWILELHWLARAHEYDTEDGEAYIEARMPMVEALEEQLEHPSMVIRCLCGWEKRLDTMSFFRLVMGTPEDGLCPECGEEWHAYRPDNMR